MSKRLKRRTTVVLLAVAAVVIGACGGGSDDKESSAGGTETATEAPAGPTIGVVGKEFSYDPAKLTLKAFGGHDVPVGWTVIAVIARPTGTRPSSTAPTTSTSPARRPAT